MRVSKLLCAALILTIGGCKTPSSAREQSALSDDRIPGAAALTAVLNRPRQLTGRPLTDDEVERLTLELAAILEAVGVVAELDLEDVPPTSHPLDVVNVWDEDVPRASLGLDDAFTNAPARHGDLFRVPPTV